MPTQPVLAAAPGLPIEPLFEIHDCIALALDIADNQCPFPEEACDLLREALGRIRAFLDEVAP